MNTAASDIARLIARDLGALEREIALFPDDETVWRTLPGVANSAGNLALHIAGNLQHFVGAVLGGSGYVRDRPSEFSRRSGTRSELVAGLQAAGAAVARVLPLLTADDWSREYPVALADVHARTGLFVLHFCTHLSFHLGQVGYLRRILTGDDRTSDAVAVKALGD